MSQAQRPGNVLTDHADPPAGDGWPMHKAAASPYHCRRLMCGAAAKDRGTGAELNVDTQLFDG
jgi:hypothetical protein